MKQIQKAIADRNEKELKMKLALERAHPVFTKFKEGVMTVRKADHEKKMQEFINKKGIEFKKELVEQAQRELKKIENKRKVLEAEQARKEKDARIAAEQRAKGILPESMEADGTLGIGWSRGVKVQPEVRDRDGGETFIRGAVSAKADTSSGTMTRAGFGKGTVEPKPEDRKEESKRPVFSKGPGGDAGGFGLSRSGMGTSKGEEVKTSVAAGGSGGFIRGAGAPA